MRILVIGQAAFVPNISLCIILSIHVEVGLGRLLAERFIVTASRHCDPRILQKQLTEEILAHRFRGSQPIMAGTVWRTVHSGTGMRLSPQWSGEAERGKPSGSS